MPTIQIADKPTLDNVYNQLQHKGYYKGVEISVNKPFELPYPFVSGCAVVWDDEIHILGGSSSTYTKRYHYKWDGNEWTSESILPVDFCNGSAVVWNDELHIMGGSVTNNNIHYKYSKKTKKWVSLGTIPFKFLNGEAVVWNDQIHILGTSTTDKYKLHYYFNGISWVQSSNVAVNFYNGAAVVYEGNVYVMGGTGGKTYFRVCTGLTWSTLTDVEGSAIALPYSFANGSAVVCDNKIHLLGGDGGTNTQPSWRVWDPNNDFTQETGNHWMRVGDQETLPYNFYNGCAVVYRGEIYLLGGSGNNIAMYRYSNGTREWENYLTDKVYLEINHEVSKAFNINGTMVTIGKSLDVSDTNSYIYKFNGDSWDMISSIKYVDAAVYRDELYVIGYDDDDNYIFYKIHEDLVTIEKICDITEFSNCKGIVNYKNEFHVLVNNDSRGVSHYKFVNNEWVLVTTLDYMYLWKNGGYLVVFNSKIYYFVTGEYCYFQFDGETWSTPNIAYPYNFSGGGVVVSKGRLHLFGGGSANSVLHYSLSLGASAWTKESDIPYNFQGVVCEYDDKIHLLGNQYVIDSTNLEFADPTTQYVYDGSTYKNYYYKTGDFVYYYLPANCKILYRPNTIDVLGDVTIDKENGIAEVNSTGLIKIKFLYENSRGYTII